MPELARSFQINGGSFGPADPVDTEQYFKNGLRCAEERLMLAVLQDAVKCFQQYAQAQYVWEKQLFQEAEDWILEKNRVWPFSFENICETLQLNPEYIRGGLLVWKEAKRKTHSARAGAARIPSSRKSGSVTSSALDLSKTAVGRALTLSG